jgi:hypothetical protein
LASWLDILYKIAGWLSMLDMLEGCNDGWLAVQHAWLLGYGG